MSKATVTQAEAALSAGKHHGAWRGTVQRRTSTGLVSDRYDDVSHATALELIRSASVLAWHTEFHSYQLWLWRDGQRLTCLNIDRDSAEIAVDR